MVLNCSQSFSNFIRLLIFDFVSEKLFEIIRVYHSWRLTRTLGETAGWPTKLVLAIDIIFNIDIVLTVSISYGAINNL